MKRRAFVSVIVVGGIVWRAYDTGVFRIGESAAFEPWKDWRDTPPDGPLSLVRAAILASNPFNTQPWLFRVGDSWVEVYADNTRNTGAFDPYLRELRIGLGCAIENLMVAAPANGYDATLTIQPGTLSGPTSRPDRELVARVELDRASRIVDSESYRAIPQRHTNRCPYDVSRPVPPDFVTALASAVAGEPDVRLQLFTSDADKARFVDACEQAVLADLGNGDARQGTGRWTRDWHSLQRLHDGTSIDESGWSPLRVAVVKFFPSWMRPGGPPTDITKAIKAGYTDLLMTGRLFGSIEVRDLYDQPQSVKAGRAWQRAHLLATARGLAARPANQPVQLYDHQHSQGKHWSEEDGAWRPTFMFFMGYPTRAANASARRGVREVTI